MRKRHDDHEEEEHENHEAWVIPYADMLTLLMGLFVVLWSISNADLSKLEALQGSFASSLGLSLKGESQLPANSNEGGGPLSGSHGLLDSIKPAMVLVGEELISQKRVESALDALEREETQQQAQRIEDRQLAEVEEAISQHATSQGYGDAVQFRREGRGLVVSIVSDQVLFEPGSADLRPDGRIVLDGLASILFMLPNELAIEGHTDNVPIATSRFPSNWELSTARATSVLQYLVTVHHFPAERLRAAGFGEYRPLSSNDQPEGRRQNRRVEVAVLSMLDVNASGEIITPGEDS